MKILDDAGEYRVVLFVASLASLVPSFKNDPDQVELREKEKLKAKKAQQALNQANDDYLACSLRPCRVCEGQKMVVESRAERERERIETEKREVAEAKQRADEAEQAEIASKRSRRMAELFNSSIAEAHRAADEYEAKYGYKLSGASGRRADEQYTDALREERNSKIISMQLNELMATKRARSRLRDDLNIYISSPERFPSAGPVVESDAYVSEELQVTLIENIRNEKSLLGRNRNWSSRNDELIAFADSPSISEFDSSSKIKARHRDKQFELLLSLRDDLVRLKVVEEQLHLLSISQANDQREIRELRRNPQWAGSTSSNHLWTISEGAEALLNERASLIKSVNYLKSRI